VDKQIIIHKSIFQYTPRRLYPRKIYSLKMYNSIVYWIKTNKAGAMETGTC
jgi:hypothetical protein